MRKNHKSNKKRGRHFGWATKENDWKRGVFMTNDVSFSNL